MIIMRRRRRKKRTEGGGGEARQLFLGNKIGKFIKIGDVATCEMQAPS